MMGLIGQGCEHGDVLEVTGTNTPTQKTHLVFFMCGQLRRARLIAPRIMCLPQKEE